MGPQPRRRAPVSPVRPRYGRILAAFGSVGVTMTAVLGAAGVLPGLPQEQAVAVPRPGAAAEKGALQLSRYAESRDPSGAGEARSAGSSAASLAGDALPAGSGSGKRVVFDMSAQRVWLVEASGKVLRTYLVSGSRSDNLEPGDYEVYSRSRHALGVDDSGTMEYMVRFAHGDSAAIGFHDIPVDHGRPVQTREELGTPQSHGCIRQWRPDARALWGFASVGTKVVVVR